MFARDHCVCQLPAQCCFVTVFEKTRTVSARSIAFSEHLQQIDGATRTKPNHETEIASVLEVI